ncbi:hypothetical protein AB0N50_28300 [Streptomyces pharetrae]|uniref:hypothetical protein n=1 Tax=Streptomyces pharetrae TaxID=291370 RepID=UPI00345FCB49
MRASLGTRLAGLLLTGSLSLLAAACADGGNGSSNGGQGGNGGTSVAGGVSGGREEGDSEGPEGSGGSGTTGDSNGSDSGGKGTGGALPTWRATDDGSGGTSGDGDGEKGRDGGQENGGGDDGGGHNSGGDNAGGGNGGGGNEHSDGPAWLPPGPHSPNTEGQADPESVYDVLRAPSRCQDALDVMPDSPPDADWRILRGLAQACLAIQGGGGNWETAALDYSAVADQLRTCKGRAARQTLAGLLDFHRRNPEATASLENAPGGTAACAFRITSVDAGGDTMAKPGDTIRITLQGTYFDHGELLRDGWVRIGRAPQDHSPGFVSEDGDKLVLSTVVPELPASPTESFDVVVHYIHAEAIREAALSIEPPSTAAIP